jgi:hypothetical protein
MNCKPGDLAIVIRSNAGNEGLIVAVERWADARTVTLAGGLNRDPGWLCVARAFNVFDYGQKRVVGTVDRGVFPDKNLRPIRDNDGEDETLSWAGLPVKQTA